MMNLSQALNKNGQLSSSYSRLVTGQQIPNQVSNNYYDPSQVISEVIRHDTGSSNYFPIGKYIFIEKTDNSIPIWDKKQLIMGKKYGLDSP